MLEREYQARLIRKLRELFPGCVILKNDPDYLQGIPDLVIFYGNRWAMLEVKSSRSSRTQPNQDYYVQLLDEMSFAAFIYPENEEAILRDLQRSLASGRLTRLPQRE